MLLGNLGGNAFVSEQIRYSTKLPPCFFESVFSQELEKAGFSFVRDRERSEKRLCLAKLNKIARQMVNGPPCANNTNHMETSVFHHFPGLARS